MRVVIAGGHGKIGLRLSRLLTDRGDVVIGIVRDPAQQPELRSVGALAAVADLERVTVGELSAVLTGADAVVFAAGAGPGSGAARKDTVDRAASGLLAEAAQRAEVRRFLQVSSMGLGRADDQGTDRVFAAYLRAKAAAERDLTGRDLDWTILRPGRLTDDPGTGRVTLGPPPLSGGTVSRDDVAAVLLALLDEPATVGRTLELVGGNTPVAEAVRSLNR